MNEAEGRDQASADAGDADDGDENHDHDVDGVDRDDDSLQILVELAAHGDLSPEDTAEVERLIGDKPQLLAEYDRLREGRQAAPPPSASTSNAASGCMFALGAFVLGLVVVLAVGVLLISRSGGDSGGPVGGTTAVDAVIESADQESLVLQGPDDLTAPDRLALIYSANADAAVLLGADIPAAGVLYNIAEPDITIASFDAGTVTVLIDGFDPNLQYAVRPTG